MHRLMPRMLGFTLLGCLVIPAVYYGSQYVSATTLYPGDVVEVRPCRYCQGDPEEQIDWPTGRCMACRATGEVDVIIPGPNRPTTIHGAVIRPDMDYGGHMGFVASNAILLTPYPGGVPDVEVEITSEDGTSVRMVTNTHGRFLASLAPGEYTARIRARGYPPTEEAFTVEPLSAEIWREHARVIVEPSTEAEQNAWYGRPLTFVLEE